MLVLVHDPSLAFVLHRKVPLGLHGRVTVKCTSSDLSGQAYDLMLEDHHSQFRRALDAVRSLPRADNRPREPGDELDDEIEIKSPAGRSLCGLATSDAAKPSTRRPSW